MAPWFLDGQVERAWSAFRIHLGDRLAAGAGQTEPLTFGYRGDECFLSFSVGPHGVVVNDGLDTWLMTNVDQAASHACAVMQERWDVPHPSFLDAGQGDPALRDPVPLLGRAASRLCLQEWVHATLEREFPGPLPVFENGNVAWRNQAGLTISIRTHSQDRVDLWVTLGSEVDRRRASRTMDRLSSQHVAFNFRLIGDALVMMQSLYASPFVPEHLVTALRRHMQVTDQLGWVQTKVRRRPERTLAGTTRVDPELLALLPTARGLSLPDLAEELTRAAGGSRARLRAWRLVVSRAHDQARDLPRGVDDRNQVNRNLRESWKHLDGGLTLAIDQWQRPDPTSSVGGAP